ncbi:MAG: hypothetical protein WC054_06520 [Candidatus Nanopelagicales bacterium]
MTGSGAPFNEAAFGDVPAADESAVPDPRYLELRANSDLPTTYMPPAMAGDRPPWIRAVSLALVATFLTATAAGICLTYGPGL